MFLCFSNRINLALFVIASMLAMASPAQEIYRQVDEQGRVIFSDRPQDGGEPVTLTPINRSEPLTETETKNKQPTTKDTPPAKPPASYESIKIIQPANEEVIRSNAGDLNVSIEVLPGLAKGDSIRLLIDGAAPLNDSANGRFQLSNLDRGSHQLKAQIIDAAGRILIESPSVTVHLMRHSRLAPKPP